MEEPSLKGTLLIASPVMMDPNFAGSVVLVCVHDDEGSVGLVLDRPTELSVADHLPAWARHATPPRVVFLGGPVNVEMAIGVGEAHSELTGWSPVVGTTGLIDLEAAEPADVGRLRVFAGYAGWSAGQLDAEVAALDWVVVPAHPDDPFAEDPAVIRQRALARKGGLYPAYDHY
ncbi:MAG: YqgE/AlgH family protein, partial [Thermoanaerobaculia bacterium]|nr:YqgE/AlgH family protein [Thermoanaerobaculia bacterium]